MNDLGAGIHAIRLSRPSAAALSDPTSALTNRELIDAANSVADAVLSLAPHQAPMVAVTLPLSVDAIVMLLAAITGDYSVCFLDPNAPDEKRCSITAAVCPDVVVEATGVRPSDSGRMASPNGTHPTGYVAMSSGSTGGTPKGVLSPWSTISAFAPFGQEAFGLDRAASWAEISHLAYDMAMTNMLVALWSGATIHVSAAFGDRLRPLRFVDRVQATHLRLAPRFIDLAGAERRPHGAPSLRVWGSGGDRLFPPQAEQVFGLGVPVVVNTYGTSETAGFASAARLTADGPLTTAHGSVTIGRGAVGAWRAKLVPRGDDAMLAIATPYRPSGHLFGRSNGEFPRWQDPDTVLTGDLGVEVAGDLFCLGRLGRRVKRNATFVDLDEVDATIRGASGVVSFTVATADGTLSTLVEVKSGDVGQLHRSLPTVLRPDVVPERLVPVSELPRLGNGKVDHAAAHSVAERGQ
jgi:acyl-coenzyme A synthetase/AMP-(fatty) acid ligase